MFFFKSTLLTELQKACGKGQLTSCLFAKKKKKKKVVYVTERNINKNHCHRKLLDPFQLPYCVHRDMCDLYKQH